MNTSTVLRTLTLLLLPVAGKVAQEKPPAPQGPAAAEASGAATAADEASEATRQAE